MDRLYCILLAGALAVSCSEIVPKGPCASDRDCPAGAYCPGDMSRPIGEAKYLPVVYQKPWNEDGCMLYVWSDFPEKSHVLNMAGSEVAVARASMLYREKTGRWPQGSSEMYPPRCSPGLCLFEAPPRNSRGEEIEVYHNALVVGGGLFEGILGEESVVFGSDNGKLGVCAINAGVKQGELGMEF